MQNKANPCLKWIFILFSFLLGIAGSGLLVLAVMALHHKVEGAGAALFWVFVVAIASICLCFIGAYGAYKERPGLLKAFMGMMLTGTILMVIAAARVSAAAPQLKELMKTYMGELKGTIMYDDELQRGLHTVENENQCCGITGYSDYKDYMKEIPSTCECSSQDKNTNRCSLVSSSSSSSSYSFLYTQNDEKIMNVYNQGCGPILLSYFDQGIQIALRAIVALAAVAFVGFLLSSFLLCQMSGHLDVAAPDASVSMAPVGLSSISTSYAPLHKGEGAQHLIPASSAWP